MGSLLSKLLDFLHVMISFFLSDYIECEFEEDFCHWQLNHTGEPPIVSWSRQTGKTLQALEIDGPKTDHLDSPENYFVFATGSGSISRDGQSQSAMFSPWFETAIHPEECLQFYYMLMVLI